MFRRPASRLLRALATLAVAGITLTACAGTVALQPATQGTDPACASVVVRLPDVVAAAQSRETNAQGTGAWGTPASVLLVCGVPPPGPTTARCLSIAGVDWVEDDSAAPRYRYTTFGRSPAVEVTVDSTRADPAAVLPDLAAAVSIIPTTRPCLGEQDLPMPAPAVTPVPTPTVR